MRYVFLGPTMSAEAAKELCDVVVLPPVAQGDVAALLRHNPTAIGIVDGYYESVPSVWHKEILLALKRGIAVFGAGSLGALRAAECDSFGMRGIGSIYEWYRDGVIDADDEVAVRHVLSDRAYRATNVALVNVRATLEAAKAAGALDDPQHTLLLDAARGLHYTQRTLGEIAAEAAKEKGSRKDWLALLRTYWVDQKRLDATALLKAMAKVPRETCTQQPNAELEVHITTKIQDLFERDTAITWQDEVRVTPQMLADFMRVILQGFPDFETRALLQAYALYLARIEPLTVAKTRKERLEKVLQREIGDLESWRKVHHLTSDECEQFWQDQLNISEAFATFEVSEEEARHWRNRATVRDLVRQAILEGCYERLFAAFLERELFLLDSSGSANTSADLNTLHRFFCGMHPRYDGKNFAAVAELLGFPDQTAYFYEVNRVHRFEMAQTKLSHG